MLSFIPCGFLNVLEEEEEGKSRKIYVFSLRTIKTIAEYLDRPFPDAVRFSKYSGHIETPQILRYRSGFRSESFFAACKRVNRTSPPGRRISVGIVCPAFIHRRGVARTRQKRFISPPRIGLKRTPYYIDISMCLSKDMRTTIVR